MYQPNDLVDVTWDMTVGEQRPIKVPPWKNKKIVELRRFASGDLYALLEGHPFCPVNTKRLSKHES